jgi:hypothetical protein
MVKFKGRVVFKQYIPPKKAKDMASKCSNCVTLLDVNMT